MTTDNPARLSDRIVAAQKPIRILDHIKWDNGIQEDFFKNGAKELPKMDHTYYGGRPLGFRCHQKASGVPRNRTRHQPQTRTVQPLGAIMRRMCREYIQVVRMLEARGTLEFAVISQELYGSASDAFHEGGPTLADLGKLLGDAIASIDQSELLKPEEKTITGEEAVRILQKRINAGLQESEGTVRVMLSDGILADAAAGADYIKLRREAKFNERDLRVLEVHEGWVHLGTTLNGSQQPICTFLSKGPPSSTITQEGLAILMEIITFASYPSRLNASRTASAPWTWLRRAAISWTYTASSWSRTSVRRRVSPIPRASSVAARPMAHPSPRTCPTTRASS